jgi:protein-tyrosine phosphatase
MIFETIPNFRDAGGHRLRDGRRMRRGLLFRAAQWTGDADLAALKAQGIATIVDLRRPLERQKHPCPHWPDVRIIEHAQATGGALPPHLAALIEAGDDVQAADALMHHIYRDMPFDPMNAALLGRFFAELAQGEGAVLIHCAAGKDRTGVAVALVHHLLGVEPDAMLADYMATGHAEWTRTVAEGNLGTLFARGGNRARKEVIDVVLSVDPSYLRAAFDAIAERHGSPDAYLRDAAGVTDARRAAIVKRFTEEGL